MEIDYESAVLLCILLRESPQDHQYILCVLARSNAVPSPIKFGPNTEYPTFYGYYNEKIPFFLMGKGIISNVPRQGYAKRLISSAYLAYAETSINNATSFDVPKKLEFVSRFITLDNNTAYKDAEVYLVFRDKAIGFIANYVDRNRERLSQFLSSKLGRFEDGRRILCQQKEEAPNWPKEAKRLKNSFIFDEKNQVDFLNDCSIRFKIFNVLFEAKGGWVSIDELASFTQAGDAKRTIRQIQDERLTGNPKCPAISIEERTNNGRAERCLIYSPAPSS